MKDEERLIEVMADLLAEVHEMRMDMNKRLGNLEKQQAKTNLALGELRLSAEPFPEFAREFFRSTSAVGH